MKRHTGKPVPGTNPQREVCKVCGAQRTIGPTGRKTNWTSHSCDRRGLWARLAAWLKSKPCPP